MEWNNDCAFRRARCAFIVVLGQVMIQDICPTPSRQDEVCCSDYYVRPRQPKSLQHQDRIFDYSWRYRPKCYQRVETTLASFGRPVCDVNHFCSRWSAENVRIFLKIDSLFSVVRAFRRHLLKWDMISQNENTTWVLHVRLNGRVYEERYRLTGQLRTVQF